MMPSHLVSFMSAQNEPWAAEPEFIVHKLNALPLGTRCDGIFAILSAAKPNEPERVLYIDHSHLGGDVFCAIQNVLRTRTPQLADHGASYAAVKTFKFGKPRTFFLLLLEEQCAALKAKFPPVIS